MSGPEPSSSWGMSRVEGAARPPGPRSSPVPEASTGASNGPEAGAQDPLPDMSFAELLDCLKQKHETVVAQSSLGALQSQVVQERTTKLDAQPSDCSLVFPSEPGGGLSPNVLSSQNGRETADSMDTPGLCLCHVWENEQPPERRAIKQRSVTMSVIGLKTDAAISGGDTLRDESTLQPFVMHPNSRKRIIWDTLSTLVLVHDVLMIPMAVFNLGSNFATQMISRVTTAFWTVDIFMSLLTGFHNFGCLEMRPGMIARRYVRSWFPLDLMVSILDWMFFALETGLSDYVGIMRLGKLVRFSRVLRLFRLLRAMKLPGLLDSLAEQVHSEGIVVCLGVGRAVCIIALVNHFIACLWYGVGSLGVPSWTERVEGEQLSYVYLTSLHWSLTQFTPASMEIFPRNIYERVFAIVVLVSALVTFGSFVSSITAAMTHLRRIHEHRYKEHENIRRYITNNKISLDLGNRISAFMHGYRFMSRRRIHEEDIAIFKVLPKSLLLHLRWETYCQVLLPHPMFFGLRQVDGFAVLNICNEAMGECSMVTALELWHPGAELDKMYFPLSGTMTFTHPGGELQTRVAAKAGGACDTLTPWLCEIALYFRGLLHCGRLAALSPCELFHMDAACFRTIITHAEPEVFCAVRRYAVKFREVIMELMDRQLPIEITCDKAMLQDIVFEAFADMEVAVEVRRSMRLVRSKPESQSAERQL